MEEQRKKSNRQRSRRDCIPPIQRSSMLPPLRKGGLGGVSWSALIPSLCQMMIITVRQTIPRAGRQNESERPAEKTPPDPPLTKGGNAPARSEERRVGKEGRSRWAPDHY